MFRVGPIEFTPQQVYVGVISGLIAFPANLIIVTLFRYAKERPKKRPSVTNDDLLSYVVDMSLHFIPASSVGPAKFLYSNAPSLHVKLLRSICKT